MPSKTNSTVHGRKKFRIQYNTGQKRLDSNGKLRPVYKNFYGDSKKDALAKRDKWIAEHSGLPFTFYGEMSHFIENVLSRDNSIKASSKSLYTRSWLANFKEQAFLFKPLEQVTGKILQQEIDSLNCAISTKKAIVKLLKRFYAYENIENGIIDRSQFLSAGKEPERTEGHKIDVWTESEISVLLNALRGHRLYFLVWIALNAGLRISEALALKYDDFQNGFISINKQIIHTDGGLSIGSPKSKDSFRLIPYTAETGQKLLEHKERHEKEMKQNGYFSEYVFTTSTGRFIERRNVYHALRRFCERAGLPNRRFHCFRQTFASKIAERGTPPQVLKELLGHSNIQVTLQYYVAVPDRQKTDAVSNLFSDRIATEE